MSDTIVYKCQMCGGWLDIEPGSDMAECAFCGSMQPIPANKPKRVVDRYNRANNLRLKQEFDQAEQRYEEILQDDPVDHESHWGIVLCRYGIEYVEDPISGNRIPTCHRTIYEAIEADENYQAAVENSVGAKRAFYQQEAAKIAELQKSILSVSRTVEPFDVFISYKETDNDNRRTDDSVIANDIYYTLTREGLRVFYAPITLENVLGRQYEPYIFAALNSAKVMVLVGSNIEYIEAPWVKNEWSRFLKFARKDPEKSLIVCHRNLDVRELPDEMRLAERMDMNELGFINDLLRGVLRLCQAGTNAPQATQIEEIEDVAPLLKRVQMFLEEKSWEKAAEYCERILDLEPENWQTYLYKVLIQEEVSDQEGLVRKAIDLSDSKDFSKALSYATGADKENLLLLEKRIKKELACKENAKALEEGNFHKFVRSLQMLQQLGDFENCAQLYQEGKQRIEEMAQKLAEKDWQHEVGQIQEKIRMQEKMNTGLKNQLNRGMAERDAIMGDFRKKKEALDKKLAEAKTRRDQSKAEVDRYGSEQSSYVGKVAIFVVLGIVCVILVFVFGKMMFSGNSPIFDFISYGALAFGCVCGAYHAFSYASCVGSVDKTESLESRERRLRASENEFQKAENAIKEEEKKIRQPIDQLDQRIQQLKKQIQEADETIRACENSIKAPDPQKIAAYKKTQMEKLRSVIK